MTNAKPKTMFLEGENVFVNIEPAELAGSVMKYSGKTMRVRAVKTVKGAGKATYHYYELEGAESEHGVPFAFVSDWLKRQPEA